MIQNEQGSWYEVPDGVVSEQSKAAQRAHWIAVLGPLMQQATPEQLRALHLALMATPHENPPTSQR